MGGADRIRVQQYLLVACWACWACWAAPVKVVIVIVVCWAARVKVVIVIVVCWGAPVGSNSSLLVAAPVVGVAAL